MATFWERAAHSVDNIFPLCLTICNFSYFQFWFKGFQIFCVFAIIVVIINGYTYKLFKTQLMMFKPMAMGMALKVSLYQSNNCLVPSKNVKQIYLTIYDLICLVSMPVHIAVIAYYCK